jgi:phage-related protein
LASASGDAATPRITAESIEWFREGGGAPSPVLKDFKELDVRAGAKLIANLNRHVAGTARGGQVVKKLTNDLWEIRHKTNIGAYRLVFARHKGTIVLLDVVLKKQDSTPTATATSRLSTWKKRHP